MEIRTAKIEDLEELLYIYNYEVLNGFATFDIHPQTLEERKGWFYDHNIDHHPLIVGVIDGKIAGYASLSKYREKEAYIGTVELSIYVHPDYRRQGVATKLLEAILEIARKDEVIRTIVSVITSGNEASTKLHEQFGFTYCGTIHNVGVKKGKDLSIDNYELILK